MQEGILGRTTAAICRVSLSTTTRCSAGLSRPSLVPVAVPGASCGSGSPPWASGRRGSYPARVGGSGRTALPCTRLPLAGVASWLAPPPQLRATIPGVLVLSAQLLCPPGSFSPQSLSLLAISRNPTGSWLTLPIGAGGGGLSSSTAAATSTLGAPCSSLSQHGRTSRNRCGAMTMPLPLNSASSHSAEVASKSRGLEIRLPFRPQLEAF